MTGLAILCVAGVGIYILTQAGGCRGQSLETPFEAISLHKHVPGEAPDIAAVEPWPKWRGPRGDGKSRESLGDSWPAEGLKQLWAWKVGLGYSSPVAVGERVLLFSLKDGQEVLTCFDANTGEHLWSNQSATGYTSKYEGTRATPTIVGDVVYTYGGTGELLCRNLSDGTVRWRQDVLAVGGGKVNDWGVASSPLVDNGRVYVQGGPDGHIAIAFAADTGAVIWKSQEVGISGYAAPIMADVQGTPQLIIFSGEAVIGMDPATGRTIWQQPWKTDYYVNATTPIYRDGLLYVSSEYGKGGMLFRLNPTGAEPVWDAPKRDIQSKFQGLILEGNLLYGNSRGSLVGVDWPSGKRKWKAGDSDLQLREGGSVVPAAGDKVLLLSSDGVLSLAQLTADGPRLISQFQAVEDGSNVWSVPLIYGEKVYVKGNKTFVCYALPSLGQAETQPATAETKPATAETKPATAEAK